MALAARTRLSGAAARRPAAVAVPCRRATAGAASRAVAAHYKVTLRTPDGDVAFDCAPDTVLLDAAEAAGVDVPYLCRSGTCVGCAGRKVEGEIARTGLKTLEPAQEEQGFVLLCQTYPRSDLVVLSHAEQDLYVSQQCGTAPPAAAAAAAKLSSR